MTNCVDTTAKIRPRTGHPPEALRANKVARRSLQPASEQQHPENNKETQTTQNLKPTEVTSNTSLDPVLDSFGCWSCGSESRHNTPGVQFERTPSKQDGFEDTRHRPPLGELGQISRYPSSAGICFHPQRQCHRGPHTMCAEWRGCQTVTGECARKYLHLLACTVQLANGKYNGGLLLAKEILHYNRRLHLRLQTGEQPIVLSIAQCLANLAISSLARYKNPAC